MLLRNNARSEVLHPSLVAAHSAQTLVVAREGLPLSVPSNLLTLFSSSLLGPLLDLPPCVSTSLVIPDTDLKTVSALVELLRTGGCVQDSTSTDSVQLLAKSLGINLGSVTVTTAPATEETPGVAASLATNGPGRGPTSARRRSVNIQRIAAKTVVRNIKEEATTDPGAESAASLYNCEICKKHFNAAGPLAFHYCKHFYKDLQNLSFPDYIEETRCNKCEKTFPDKKAMLCHIGVKHKFINQVLSLNGFSKVPLGMAATSESVSGSIRIKTEMQTSSAGGRSLQKKSKTTKTPRSKSSMQVDTTPRTRQKNSKDIKEVRFCEICNKELENVSQLASHMIGSHFLKEIRERYSSMYVDGECTECHKTFNRNSVWMHLGSVHNKLDEVLMSKGMRPLKIVVTPRMRKVVVKRERMEAAAEETPDYQLPNLFESVVAGAGDQEEETAGYDDQNMMTASDPLMS